MDSTTLDMVVPQVEHLIEKRRWGEIRDMVHTWDRYEIAEVMQELEKPQRVLLYRCLDRDRSADVFSYLEPDAQDALLRELTDAETRRLLAGLDPDDRTALLEELPARITKQLMSLLSAEDLREARFLLGYPDESVGRLMTPDYVSAYADSTVQQAIEHVRAYGRDAEVLNRIYIVDERGRLIDDIALRRLVLAQPHTRVADLMDHNFVSLSAFDDRERAVELMQNYDILALPVVDSRGELLGIVTVDDVMDVAQEETTEDIQKAASVEPLRTSYRQASVLTLFRKRITWLVILVLINLISASIIAHFEGALRRVIVLTAFLPMLLGTGGNAGAQSATLMLRALVTGDIELNEWFGSFVKELAVSLLLGMVLGILGWIVGLVYSGTHEGYLIGAVIGLTMVCIVVVANMVGMTLPFVLARLKLDPAVASNPLITTITDAAGLLVYFTIAMWLLDI